MQSTQLKKADQELISTCWVAKSFFSRFLGLMGKTGISDNEAVIFPRCNSIHTFFMRFPIDVVLVSARGEVVEVIESMKSWKMILPRKSARHIIEMRAGLSRELGIVVGTLLRCHGAWD